MDPKKSIKVHETMKKSLVFKFEQDEEDNN